MKFLTTQLREQLEANGRATAEAQRNGHNEPDHVPVVKLFTPDAGATWLLTEILPDGETAFGLCDLGMGCPELGYVSLQELDEARGQLGLPIERDEHVTFDKPISVYAEKASSIGRIEINF